MFRSYFMALLACSYSCWSFADDYPVKENEPHYRVLMSNDDAVCKPLANLYNEMLADNIRELKSSNEYTDYITSREYWRLNYEIIDSNLKKFHAAGFTQPPLDGDSGARYAVDFFNEGKPRIVSSLELLGNGGADTMYKFRILKRGADYETVRVSSSTTDVDPNIVDREVSLESMLRVSPTWPIRESNNVHNIIKLWMHSGNPYFVLNAYGYRANKEESNIVVFQLLPSGHKDICYVNVPLVAQPEVSDADYQEIKKVLLGCTRSRPVVGGCPSGNGLVVDVTKVYKNYAMATVSAADGSGETDIAYLQKDNGRWELLDEGTGVNPYELSIPDNVLKELH